MTYNYKAHTRNRHLSEAQLKIQQKESEDKKKLQVKKPKKAQK